MDKKGGKKQESGNWYQCDLSPICHFQLQIEN